MNFGDLNGILDTAMSGAVQFSGMPRPGPNWKVCLTLYDEGWAQDGFDYVPNSIDIIFYWKREGEERKQVLLSIQEQQLWIRALTKRGLIK